MKCRCGSKAIAANRCRECIEIAFTLSADLRLFQQRKLDKNGDIKRAIVDCLVRLTRERNETA